MIVQAIINFIVGIVEWLLNLFPNANQSTINTISSEFSTLKGWLAQWNNMFPMDTLFQVLGIMILIEAGVFAWKLYKWIASIISGGIIKH